MTRRRRYAVVAAAISIATMIAAVIAVTAMAATRAQAATIDTISGAVSCPADTTRAGSFVLPSVANGTYDGGWIGISNASPTGFDWAMASPAHINMAVVIVQGGGNSAVYTYDYLTGGLDDSDANLQAPGGSAITKVEFCLDDKLLRDIIVGGGGGSGGGGSGGGGSGGGGSGGGGIADLAVTGLVNPSVAKVGGNITWRLNVADKNKVLASTLKLTIDLSAGIAYVSGQTDRGSGCAPASARKIICDLDHLSADSLIGSVVLLAKVTGVGQHSVTAVATHSQADLDPADNTFVLKASTPKPGPSSVAGKPISFLGANISWGIAKNFKVTFKAKIRVSRATSLVLSVQDRTAAKRLTILGGSRVGSVRTNRPAKSVAARTTRAAVVGVGVIVPYGQLVKGHRLVLVAEGMQAGKRVRVTLPLTW
jgi:hypothetical protein